MTLPLGKPISRQSGDCQPYAPEQPKTATDACSPRRSAAEGIKTPGIFLMRAPENPFFVWARIFFHFCALRAIPNPVRRPACAPSQRHARRDWFLFEFTCLPHGGPP